MVLCWGTWKLESLVWKRFFLQVLWRKPLVKCLRQLTRELVFGCLRDSGGFSRGELPIWGQELSKLHLHRDEWIFWKPRTGRHKDLQMSIIDSNPTPILSISSQWHCAIAVWPACARCHCLFFGSSAMPCIDIVQKLKLLGFPRRAAKPHCKPCRVQMKGFYVRMRHRLRSVPLELEWEP